MKRDKASYIGFLFDLDGVIIDSEREYTRIWAQINREFPSGVPDLEVKIKGCTLTKILTENYHDDVTRAAVSDRLHQLENEMKYDYLPHALNFLQELKRRNLPTVLVTSSDNKKMDHLRDEIPDIFDYFRYVVTGDMVNSSKPNPEGYLKGADLIKCAPENCVVFEDSLQGVMAGKNAGSYVIGMEGTVPRESLAPYSHIIIKNFRDIDLDSLIHKLKER